MNSTCGAFGFVGAIIIDANGFIVAGEAVVKAALALGYEVVPTICLTHLSDAQVKAFRVAHNRLAELSSWDDRELGQQLKDILELKLDFDIGAIGFETAELEMRIDLIDAPAETKQDPADIIPELSSKPAITEPGTLWILDDNKILCGNALDPAS